MPFPPMSAKNSDVVGAVCGVAGAGAMLPYLEITHTESHCHVGLCLIKPNTLWKLFVFDVPNIMSAQVDGRKLTLGTSCRRETVSIYYFAKTCITKNSQIKHSYKEKGLM